MPRPPRRFKWARWALAGGAALLIVAVVGLLFAPRPVPVDAATAVRGPIAETVADQGMARVREAYVIAAPVSGRLERVSLEVGDPVQAGTTIVARIRPASADLLDPRTRAQAQAAVATARAAVAVAAAQHQQALAEARRAGAEAARVRKLAGQGFASPQALDTAEATARAASAGADSAAAQLRMRRSEARAAEAALIGPEAGGDGDVAVTSPASGYVTRVLQESARTVAVGAPLLEVSDGQGLEAAIEFLSQDAVRIREGMAAEVYDWGGPGSLAAVVRRVEPQGFTKVSALGVEEQRVLVMLQFKAPAKDGAALGPGYRVWGRVVLRSVPDAVKAPLGALVRKDGGWAVFRIADGRARLTAVQVGAITDVEAEVPSGLAAGDRVVVFPSDRVRDGVRVRVRRGAGG